MHEGFATHMRRLARSSFVEMPMVETVNQQVRTSMSVPFQRHMLGDLVDAPMVETVNQQVRTSMSVPFAPHMKGSGAMPTVETVNQQVRTSMSVPFAPHMNGNGAVPTVETVNQQVRTSMSVPFSGYLRDGNTGRTPAVEAVNQQVRTSMSVPFNPYMLGAHAEELLKRRVMISPVLSVWQFKVRNADAFSAWLATREILLSEGRLSGDAEIRGVRYGGTYRVGCDRAGTAATFKTVWGYTSESAMLAMQGLCSDNSASATIVQLDLIDFVKGLKKFMNEAGPQSFAEEILISAAAG